MKNMLNLEKQKCTKCGLEQPLSEFHRRYDRGSEVKYHNYCKTCHREYNREYSKRRPRKKQVRRPTNEYAWGPFICF
jgi:hypothetical protein